MDNFFNGIRDRQGEKVSIFYCGRNIEGYSSEPVSLALYSKGYKVLGRSKKLYRFRGFYSLDPQDRIVLTKIGDEYVNACEIYCQDGQNIEVDFSTPFLVKVFSPLLDGYFQHRRFVKNRILWRLAVDKIKQMANHPEVRHIEARKTGRIIRVASDIVVVGGGLAGLTAAYTVSQLGLKTLIIDKSIELGGRLRYDYMDVPGVPVSREYLLEDILTKISSDGNIKTLTRTIFTGFFEDYPTAYSQEERTLYILKAKGFIIATGVVDLPCIFRNNDIPGIFSASTVLEMVNRYRVKLGEKSLIIGLSQNSLRIAEQLKRSGIDVVMVDNSRSQSIQSDLSRVGECIVNVREIEAVGRKCVEKANIIHDDGRDRLEVDFIVCSAFSNPDILILNQLDSRLIYIGGVGFVPVHDEYMHLKDNIFIAGGVSGSPYSILHLIEGEIAALSAAYKLGAKEVEPLIEEKIKEYRTKLNEMNVKWKNKVFRNSRSELIENSSFTYPPTLFIERPRRDAFICFCEDITTEDISRTVHEKGYTLLELVKRSLGVCTGRCQGRLCMVNAALYVSYLSNLDPSQVGLTKARAPVTSIPLYILAGGEEE